MIIVFLLKSPYPLVGLFFYAYIGFAKNILKQNVDFAQSGSRYFLKDLEPS